MSQASTQTPEQPGNQAFAFIGTNAFTAAGQLHYLLDATGERTIIEGNTTGTTGAEFQIQVAGLHAFVAATSFCSRPGPPRGKADARRIRGVGVTHSANHYTMQSSGNHAGSLSVHNGRVGEPPCRRRRIWKRRIRVDGMLSSCRSRRFGVGRGQAATRRCAPAGPPVVPPSPAVTPWLERCRRNIAPRPPVSTLTPAPQRSAKSGGGEVGRNPLQRWDEFFR